MFFTFQWEEKVEDSLKEAKDKHTSLIIAAELGDLNTTMCAACLTFLFLLSH